MISEADDDRDHADDERVEEPAGELRVGEDLAVGEEDVRPGPDRVEERADERQDEVEGAEDEDEPGPRRADPPPPPAPRGRRDEPRVRAAFAAIGGR